MTEEAERHANKLDYIMKPKQSQAEN